MNQSCWEISPLVLQSPWVSSILLTPLTLAPASCSSFHMWKSLDSHCYSPRELHFFTSHRGRGAPGNQLASNTYPKGLLILWLYFLGPPTEPLALDRLPWIWSVGWEFLFMCFVGGVHSWEVNLRNRSTEVPPWGKVPGPFSGKEGSKHYQAEWIVPC